MKKIVTLLVLPVFLLSVPLFGQKLGIKAGGNYAGVMGKNDKGDKLEGLSFIPGFHAGAFVEVDMGATVSLQFEACYSQKGYRDKHSTSMVIGSQTFTSEYNIVDKFSYVDVPLILNLHFGEMGGYIGLGPQVSFLVGRNYDGTITNTTTNTSPPSSSSTELTWAGKDKDGISKTDFGVLFGMGSKWESGIEYCLRAGLGLGNIVDQSTSTSNDIMHHLVFSASIGYAFNAGGGGGGDRYGHKYNRPKGRR